MKRIAVLLSTVAVMFAFIPSASAASTFTDGGYSTTSGDSSTCGPNWAFDLNVRNFRVTLPAVAGTYKVVESFVNGHFSTIAGPSPESCQASNHNTVRGGVQGTWHGFYDLTVTGVLNANGTCVLDTEAQCRTDGWVAGFFGNTASYTLDNWGFDYFAAKTLPRHHWVNACTVADTGALCRQTGNSGDIASHLAA